MNGGKLDLERERLQEMLEQSCWIINNEKNKLVVGLWKHLNTLGEILPLTKNNCLLEINEEMKTSFAKRIGENLDH